LIRPDLSVIHAAYFTRASWKNFLTRSGDFSNACMCSVAAVFKTAQMLVGTFDQNEIVFNPESAGFGSTEKWLRKSAQRYKWKLRA